jgi:2-methylcitrate dehydratase PrpD
VPLVKDLGREWHIAEISFKRWPCCRWSNPYIDAELSILKENDIKAEDIEAISAITGSSGRMMFEPLDKKRAPETGIDAKASLPFILGAAAVRRKVDIAHFLTEGLKDPAVLDMAKRVSYRSDEDNHATTILPGIVEIKTKDDKTYTNRVDYPYGHPQNPMSLDDLIEKFKGCISYSAKPLPEDNLCKAIDLLLDLENVQDVSEIIQLISH